MAGAIKPEITKEHLERNAYVYVRETSRRGGVETRESSWCEHALRERASHFDWKEQRAETGRSWTSCRSQGRAQQLEVRRTWNPDCTRK